MSKLLEVWNTILVALATKDHFDSDASVVYGSEFNDSGELRGITERVDPLYQVTDDCGDAPATPRNSAELRRTCPPVSQGHYTGAIDDTPGIIGEGLEDGALDDDVGIGFDPIAGVGTLGAFYGPARRSELGSHVERTCICSGVQGCTCPSGVWGHRAAGPARWDHVCDSHVRTEQDDSIEPTGFAENPRATYLWQSARQREARVSVMLQTIAYGPLRRVLKARTGITTQRNESICTTLGMVLPKGGSWPGVEAHPVHGMVRTYQDGDVTVTRIPDWSTVWITRGQQADLLQAIEQRLEGEVVRDAQLLDSTDSVCCRCDTLTDSIAYDPSTGVPLCQSCWLECNPSEVQTAQVAVDGGPVDWGSVLTGALVDTLYL